MSFLAQWTLLAYLDFLLYLRVWVEYWIRWYKEKHVFNEVYDMIYFRRRTLCQVWTVMDQCSDQSLRLKLLNNNKLCTPMQDQDHSRERELLHHTRTLHQTCTWTLRSFQDPQTTLQVAEENGQTWIPSFHSCDRKWWVWVVVLKRSTNYESRWVCVSWTWICCVSSGLWMRRCRSTRHNNLETLLSHLMTGSNNSSLIN